MVNTDFEVFNVGSRCINKDWFGMPNEDVWQIMSELLYFAANSFDIKILEFVLMSNHFHMIVRAQPRELSAAMQFVLAQSSRLITKSSGRINHTWRSRFFRRRIGSPHYYLHAYKYFYRNPVEAGICERVEEYPYSTLHGLLGQSRLLVPIEQDDTLFDDVEDSLRWLNAKPPDEYREAVSKALRRSEFKLPNKGMRLHPLETCLY